MQMSEVNAMNYEEFIAVFGNTVEHCSLCAAAVWRYRPFRDVRHLHDEICKFLDDLPLAGREGVLRSHPDLAGRLAKEGKLTQESQMEQRAAGMGDLTPKESTDLAILNFSYREKFGFPFVICARRNKKEAIMEGLKTRLNNSLEVEVEKGLEEVKKICSLRLLDLVEHEGVKNRLLILHADGNDC
ncbi:2-oxo-4-hydroxy-4-carboxy-5-ureidoimidazoline decarboxylase-like [Homarus americanus]|uniref:2-oxo-4-hydroxy-4-carboxy-5-ureidoimidazoline decarboxylase n=1 Tax=Homarus americanus TaxID=6706 RepID=A0A8J5MPF0_HOMAM|nr:2-oxo-4-hydroxy-4-carboxy-5-ureidoimidazoline decarboxylase-like [Homarus americanus]KAG7158948.1 2-oxo-4-hydroxy-4-carboxy-5-ureidoimidazoline decarboxylase-like [Homarus americanus]